MAEFGRKQGYPNYFIDKNSELANSFGASHTPEVFLFDGKTEKLVYKGAMDDNPSDPKSAKVIYLKNAINSMLAGKAINPAETKSVGCSIKRVKAKSKYLSLIKSRNVYGTFLFCIFNAYLRFH